MTPENKLLQLNKELWSCDNKKILISVSKQKDAYYIPSEESALWELSRFRPTSKVQIYGCVSNWLPYDAYFFGEPVWVQSKTVDLIRLSGAIQESLILLRTCVLYDHTDGNNYSY